MRFYIFEKKDQDLIAIETLNYRDLSQLNKNKSSLVLLNFDVEPLIRH